LGPLRTIVQEKYFLATIERIFGDLRRADVALEGALQALSREPDLTIYPAIASTADGILRAYKSASFPAISGVVIYFIVDGKDVVHLHDLLPSQKPAGP
jgi:hypothetical protein